VAPCVCLSISLVQVVFVNEDMLIGMVVAEVPQVVEEVKGHEPVRLGEEILCGYFWLMARLF